MKAHGRNPIGQHPGTPAFRHPQEIAIKADTGMEGKAQGPRTPIDTVYLLPGRRGLNLHVIIGALKGIGRNAGLDDLRGDLQAQFPDIPQEGEGEDAGTAIAPPGPGQAEVPGLINMDLRVQAPLPGKVEQVEGEEAPRWPPTNNR